MSSFFYIFLLVVREPSVVCLLCGDGKQYCAIFFTFTKAINFLNKDKYLITLVIAFCFFLNLESGYFTRKSPILTTTSNFLEIN